MNDLAKSVKHIMVVFLFLFIALISYIAYFLVFKSTDIAQDSGNIRLWVKRNEVLRGTIYDRDGNALTSSERVDDVSQKRTYLNEDLFVHALGYMDSKYGLSGLEESYDSELSKVNIIGNNFRELVESIKIKDLFSNLSSDLKNEGSLNFKENFNTFVEEIESANVLAESEKVGNGVVTTLDYDLQKVAYDALGSNKGAVVALNPKTGEILAMVSKPTFNANNLEAAIEQANSGSADDSPLINRAIDGLYPPGSVFKTVTLSSSLENMDGVTTRQFDDNGKIVFDDGTTLNNFAFQAHGAIDLRYAYRVSSNVVFGTLAMELGNATLKTTAENFGFNSVIKGNGLEITASRFPSLKNEELGNIAQSGIGQGSILSTPMQMALVAATVANDGVMMEPRLVNRVVDKDGNTIKTIENKELKEVISEETAETVQTYMKFLVDNNIYRWPAFDGTNAGGKTGTADYMLSDGTPAVPHGWFISVAPMEDPKIAVAVIVENGESGAGLSAEIASQVVRKAVFGE